MYCSTFGEEANVPEWAAGTAAIIKAVSEPGVVAYSAHLKSELDKERAKAGLPPTLPLTASTTPAPPPKESFKVGGIALLIIIFLLLTGKK